MTYPLLAAGVIALAIIINLALKTKIFSDQATWIVLAGIILLTVIFDTILVGLPIVTYTSEKLLGIYLIDIPIEDFSYALAAVVISLSIKKYYEKNP